MDKIASIVCVLEILKKYTDESHPIKQEEIVHYLDADYGMEVERKTVGRNLANLKELGYDIQSSGKGSYLGEREFQSSEIRVLIDAVLSNKSLNDTHSRELLDKIIKMGGRNFDSHTNHILSVMGWNKTDNKSVFYHLDALDEAIEKKQALQIDYGKYGVDKILHKEHTFEISPYQFIIHNQRYYLMCKISKYNTMSFLKVDRIMAIRKKKLGYVDITKVEGYEHGIDYHELNSARPYMFSDRVETIIIRCRRTMVDEIIEWFGKDVGFYEDNTSKNGKYIIAYITSSPKAFKYWALQFGEMVEVVEPLFLREEIKKAIDSMAKKYKD